MTDTDALHERFQAATAAYHEADLEAKAEMAALQLLAGHALAVAPDATHMLMESSDQGHFMCVPAFLVIGEDHQNEEAWDARVEEYDDELSQAASWLTWGHDWEEFVDEEHPFTRTHSGYYAIDLRKLGATL